MHGLIVIGFFVGISLMLVVGLFDAMLKRSNPDRAIEEPQCCNAVIRPHMLRSPQNCDGVKEDRWPSHSRLILFRTYPVPGV